jgi:hypothetical protein
VIPVATTLRVRQRVLAGEFIPKGATKMATATVTPKTKKAAKKVQPAKAQPEKKVAPKAVAYNGFCIAKGFYTKLSEAQAALESAKASDKDRNFRWSIYAISAAAKDAVLPEGTEASPRDGYAVAVGFDRSAVKAAAMLKAAEKHGKFYALRVLATKAHAKGTKQAKLAAAGK